MKSVDVTPYVDFELNDDQSLPVTMCVCGQKFPAWEFVIDMDENYPTECSVCGAKLYFGNSIRVYQVIEDEEGKK